MYHLYIFLANSYPPDAAKMPVCLASQILDHDSRQNHQFRLHVIQDGMIGQIEPVGDLGADPGFNRTLAARREHSALQTYRNPSG